MISLTPADLADERAVATPKPVAIVHFLFVFPGGREAWCNMNCYSHGEVESAVRCERGHGERFYIEWTGALLDDATLNTEVKS